jgi:serine/threonine protein kinase
MNTALPPSGNDPAFRRTKKLPTESESVITVTNAKPMSENALPIGTQMEEFEIVGFIGEGGFGIVYLAYDHSLRRQVALKEYMPVSLATRSDGTTVEVKSERYAETFQAGLRSFVTEARLLADFDHPSLVKVYRFWESNGTAYMVMPFYQGATLEDKLSHMSEPPDEAWLKWLLAQLLEALAVVHAGDCLHRDIAPDNILILPDGRPLLLDFGAARRVIGDKTQSLTVILKSGYAPVEQYANDPTMKQGTWTDIYAVGGVIYYAITGKTPIPSVSRLISDSLEPLSKAAKGRYSTGFLKTIEAALAVRPQDRPQNIEEFRTRLGLTGPQSMAELGSNGWAVPTKRPRTTYIAAFVTILAVLGGSIFFVREKPPGISAIPTAMTPSLPTGSSAVAEKKYDPLKALDEIFEGRDRNHAVTVSTDNAQARIGKDALRFKIRSAKTGYAYIYMVGTNNSDFFLLFPNALDKRNYVKAGEQLDLPKPEWKMIAEGPPGTDHFVVIVSDYPRDLTGAGLELVDPFAEFPYGRAERLYRAHTDQTPLFAGKAVCAGSTRDCSESYGAAVFSIEEIPES